MRILITSGATREPIDDVRYISNVSTGRTGSLLAEILCKKGHEVILLHGAGAEIPKSQPDQRLECREFLSFKDLNHQLQALLAHRPFDCVIQAAAVSDFSVDKKIEGKISSDQDLVLHLKSNPKLVLKIKEYARQWKIPCVVAFKLTHTSNEEERIQAVKTLSDHSAVDLVVHNDLSEVRPGGSSQHRFTLYEKQKRPRRCESVQELADALNEGVL